MLESHTDGFVASYSYFVQVMYLKTVERAVKASPDTVLVWLWKICLVASLSLNVHM